MEEGIVKHWDDRRGFGFIKREQAPDVFVHATALTGSLSALREGQRVAFDMTTDERSGRERASNVRVLAEGP